MSRRLTAGLCLTVALGVSAPSAAHAADSWKDLARTPSAADSPAQAPQLPARTLTAPGRHPGRPSATPPRGCVSRHRQSRRAGVPGHGRESGCCAPAFSSGRRRASTRESSRWACVVGARRVGGAGPGCRSPCWCRTWRAGRSSSGAWRMSGRSVAAPSADHAGQLSRTNGQVTGCARSFGHPEGRHAVQGRPADRGQRHIDRPRRWIRGRSPP